MAHRTTHRHRRNLATPDPKASMVPSVQNHPKPSTSSSSDLLLTANQDPTIPSQPISTKRINPSHKVRTSQKPTNPSSPHPSAANIDTQLQVKALSVSAIFDSSNFSLVKPNRQHHTARTAAPSPKLLDKESTKTAYKPPSKQKSNNKFQEAGHFKKSLATPTPTRDKELNSIMLGSIDMRKLSVSLDGGGGGGRRRRSFCGAAQVEVADFLASSGARIVSVDMPPFMQIHAVDFARKTRDSLEKFTAKTLALNLKKEFDGVYGPAWHCIVGTSFGSFVTHSVGGFLYFSLDHKLYVLLFKTTVQRAAD